MAKNSSRGPEVKQAIDPLEKMKLEIATELGIPNYDKLDKGDLPARIHGKIGGNMVKRMIQSYESMLAEQNNASTITLSDEVTTQTTH